MVSPKAFHRLDSWRLWQALPLQGSNTEIPFGGNLFMPIPAGVSKDRGGNEGAQLF
jgi:hypothetical protein